ncbi:MAG: alpha/beta family hydrolase [Rhodoplanes sp.]
MSSSSEEAVTIVVDGSVRVSGLLQRPPRPRTCYVVAHGVGAGMTHPFMAAVAAGLVERGLATLRFQFPYMEQCGKRPDSPKLAQATIHRRLVSMEPISNRLALLQSVAAIGRGGGRLREPFD